MRKLVVILLVAILTTSLLAEKRAVPLLALRMQFAGFENTIWMEQRARVGGESVVGYIQGVGGRDDAIMGFELKDQWDVLETTIGYLDGTPEGRSCRFLVEGNGKTLYDSGRFLSGDPSKLVRVALGETRRLLLRIQTDRYNHTAGAAFGAPTLVSGVDPNSINQPVTVDVDGQRSRFTPTGGAVPSRLDFPMPVKPGVHDYRVRIDYNEEGRTITVVTEEMPAQE